MRKVFENLHISVIHKDVLRIGKKDHGRKRPIKVKLNYKEDKVTIMKNLFLLKNKTEYKGVSITDDYTVSERDLIKQLRVIAEERNEAENDSNFVWKIRGTPRTTIELIMCVFMHLPLCF